MRFPFFKNRPWSLADLNPPWQNRKSIYWHIANHIEEDALGLTKGGEELPDEEIVRGDSAFGWVAGGFDGAFGHHAAGEEAERTVDSLFKAIEELTKDSSERNLKRLYKLATSAKALGIVDQVIERMIANPPTDQDRLHTLARWLAMEAADREIVKLAIAMIGLFRDESDLDLLMTLGRHEEFTLFVTVAIQNLEHDVENRLWKLAQHVHGWGRISIVERLASTTDDYIKDWLVREGYQNYVMLEYTALICARTGEIHRRLKGRDLDDELIKGIGEILEALLAGAGPAEGYESYPEGPESIEEYLNILANRENRIDALVFAAHIETFLADDDTFADLEDELREDWLSRRSRMLASVARIKDQSGWDEKILEEIGSKDRVQFWKATEAAKTIGIDPWEHFFERINNGEDYWWNALQTDDPDRIDVLVRHAEETIPLEEIATGPADELGIGPAFAEHRKLDWLLQELKRFPGKGLKLIEAGLKSPVTRNRNMAVNAIAEIEIAERPGNIQSALRRAYETEPNAETRKLMEKVMEGGRIQPFSLTD